MNRPKIGAQETAWPGVPGDEVFNRDMFELGLDVADALLTEDEDAIIWRAETALLEAHYKEEVK